MADGLSGLRRRRAARRPFSTGQLEAAPLHRAGPGAGTPANQTRETLLLIMSKNKPVVTKFECTSSRPAEVGSQSGLAVKAAAQPASPEGCNLWLIRGQSAGKWPSPPVAEPGPGAT